MENPLTICVRCRHFMPSGQQWYQQFCRASPRDAAIDPVTGKPGFQATNDLGRTYITQEQYAYARDINNGACSLYQENGTPHA